MMDMERYKEWIYLRGSANSRFDLSGFPKRELLFESDEHYIQDLHKILAIIKKKKNVVGSIFAYIQDNKPKYYELFSLVKITKISYLSELLKYFEINPADNNGNEEILIFNKDRTWLFYFEHSRENHITRLFYCEK